MSNVAYVTLLKNTNSAVNSSYVLRRELEDSDTVKVVVDLQIRGHKLRFLFFGTNITSVSVNVSDTYQASCWTICRRAPDRRASRIYRGLNISSHMIIIQANNSYTNIVAWHPKHDLHNTPDKTYELFTSLHNGVRACATVLAATSRHAFTSSSCTPCNTLLARHLSGWNLRWLFSTRTL